jgi:hypothetical protein
MESCIENGKKYTRPLPIWGWAGIVLVAIFWPLNWILPGSRTLWAFFPMWTGYALVVDSLVFMRTGTSQLTRNRMGFILLFLISAPCWWLFEVFNQRILNWHYLGVESISRAQYIVFSSFSFSTVIPSVFGTAELVSSFAWARRISINWRIPNTRRTAFWFLGSGGLMLGLLLIWPVYFFPFLWVSLYFIIEPINLLLGNSGLYQFTDKKEWRPVVFLFIGVIICGFFWEFWNYFSYPKWIYIVPFVGKVKIFEMPVLGYFGYLPFSLELCAIFQLINRYLKIPNTGLFPVFTRIVEGED